MIDIVTALNDHELNPDLRISFWSEWKFNKDPNPETRIKIPLFQEIEDAIRETIKPFAGAGYRLSLVSRYLEWNGNRFDARHVTPLMTATAKSSEPSMAYAQEPQPIAGFLACPSCQGSGAGEKARPGEAGVPEPIRALQGALAEKFKAPQFAKMRDHRGGLIASGLQRMEGGQGPQKAEFHPVGPGLLQILFTGAVFGFESKLPDRVALVHCPDAWNYPVKLPGIHGADAWSYPDNAVKRTNKLADELGVDPNAPREHVDHPWRRPCVACKGRGHS